MDFMAQRFLYILLAAVMLASCGEYNKVLKSTDYNYKFDYAKKAFEKGKYAQAYTILTDLIPVFKGTDKAEESLYLLALSYYENKDYISSGSYFKSYYVNYPKGQYTELARFYSGYGYYLDSPESQLDQTDTYKAIEELQGFLDYFPKSDKVSIAQNAIFELQDKLVFKELQNAQLYYNLGNYMGNNYESAVIVAKNAIKDYPYSKYREDFAVLIMKSKFQLAEQSIESKKLERYRDAEDECYGFINQYPDSDAIPTANKYIEACKKFLKE